MKYLIGIILLVVGFGMAVKPGWLQSMFGRVDIAEGGVFSTFGGSRAFFQLLGLALIIVSAIIMFGRFNLGFLTKPFSMGG